MDNETRLPLHNCDPSDREELLTDLLQKLTPTIKLLKDY